MPVENNRSLILTLKSNHVLQLTVVAAASLLLYFFGLTQRYSLFVTWLRRYPNLGNTVGFQPASEAAFALVFAGAFLLYWVALRIARTQSNRLLWWIVIGGIVAFNLCFLTTRPFDSSDIFDNIMRGRIQAIYHGNPFYQTPNDFRQDPFNYYTFWKNVSSAYGPWWEIPAAGIAWLAGNDLKVNILLFKAISVLAYGITTVLIAKTAQRYSGRNALWGVIFFAWNPLVLYSTAGNGHNDAMMVMYVVLGFYWLSRGRYTLAALAETAAALVKFIPALLVPVVIVAGIRSITGWKARIRYVIVTALSCGLLVAVSYGPYWSGGDILAISRRAALFTTSLPTLLRNYLTAPLGETSAEQLVAYTAVSVLSLWVGRTLWQQWKHSDQDAPYRAGASILMFYLLVTCLWFHAWYVTWPLAVIALLPEGSLAFGVILLSITASAQSPIFHWLLVRGASTLPPRIWLDNWLTTLTLGLPWMYFISLGIRSAITRFRQQKREDGTMRKALMVVAKRPAPGETKTRLSPPLSPEQAAQLYECFLHDTLNTIREIPDVTPMVAYLPEIADQYFDRIAPGFKRVLQTGKDLGERLDNALTACLSSGFDQAVIMDSDSPTLPAEYLARAFSELENADVVLGPCEDGGYYLIGMKRPQPRLLRGVQMSTPTVLKDTLVLAEQEGLHVALLPSWYDVDTSAELERLKTELARSTDHIAPRTLAFLRENG